MKILQVCRQYHPSVGGAERFVAALSQRLAARGHAVEVATLNRRWRHDGTLPARETVNGIRVHRLPYVGGPLYYAAPGVLRLAAQYDVIHVHHTDFFLDLLAAARALHRRPLVVSTHGGFFHTSDQAAFKRLYFKLITRRSLGAASVVVPNSPSDERRFAPYARRAVRIDNAIDCESFARARRRPIPGRLITVGRLAANKNLPCLLTAFARAREQRPDLSLTIVGGGPLRPELESQAGQLGIGGAAHWAGEVDDSRLLEELSAAEIFVSAAAHEAFGLALLEAMAAGLIPVVNDIEAFRDVIAHGQNGFIADFSRPDEAASALLRAVGLPAREREAVRKAALETAQRHDWAIALPKFEEVYRLAIAEARR